MLCVEQVLAGLAASQSTRLEILQQRKGGMSGGISSQSVIHSTVSPNQDRTSEQALS